jgi:hypothetical protein
LVHSRNTDLDEAELLRVSVKAVGLSIEGKPLGSTELRQKLFELLVCIDHARI